MRQVKYAPLMHLVLLGVLGLGSLTKSRREYLDSVVSLFIEQGLFKEDNGRLVLVTD
jgi:hypothetical protein